MHFYREKGKQILDMRGTFMLSKRDDLVTAVAMKQTYESANPAYEQVDHVVPLKHPLVCGLNVPWNLQVETIKANQDKSNHYWPDCPDHLCPIKNLPADMFGHNAPHQMGLGL